MTTPDAGGAIISCPGHDDVVIPPPSTGTCTIANVDGGRALTCDGVTTTIADPCTIVNDGAGSTTITCPGIDPVVITESVPCTVVADATAHTATVTCPGSDPLVIDTDPATCSVTTATNGTQTVTCSDGTTAVLAAASTRITRFESTPGLVLTVVSVGGGTGVGGNFAAGDSITVTYSLADRAGNPVALSSVDSSGAWFSGPTSNYQHIIPVGNVKTLTDVKTLSVDNGDGTYTYTFSTPIPANFGTPLNDTATYGAADGELSGPLTDGTYTVVLTFFRNFYVDGARVRDASTVTRDVLFGAATSLEPRAVVGVENCNGCHTAVEGHGARYNNPSICVTCHTSGAETPEHDAPIDFRVMIHRLHDGAHLPSVNGISTDAAGARVYATSGTPNVIHGNDFSDIVFPMMPNFQIEMPHNAGYSALSRTAPTGFISPSAAIRNVMKGITSCGTCHGDADGAGPLSAPAQGDHAFTTPSRRACGSCHDDLDFTKPYVQNSSTMPANRTDAQCTGCHAESGDATAVRDAHAHPMAAGGTTDPDNVMAITAVAGGSGPAGAFAAGDSPEVTFTIKDPAGADVPLTNYDSFTLSFTGPTSARQEVWPSTYSANPFDFTGRLQTVSGANGNMSKVMPGGTTTSAALKVNFTSSTDFTVASVAGTTETALGGGTLAGATSTIPSGVTFTNFKFASDVTAQALTVAFDTATTFTVSNSSGSIGTGVLPNSINTLKRFVSTDGKIEFNVTVGTTAITAPKAAYITIVKGTTNPVLFAVVAGRTAYAAGDRFYYDYVAPAATYTTRIPMDVTTEFLGTGTSTAGQVLTAANAPIRYGRQTLYEQTAVTATTTTLTAANRALATWLYVSSATGFSVNDYVLVDGGTSNAEYAKVSAVSTSGKTITLVRQRGLRFVHNAGATVTKVTLTVLREGTDYTLNPTTGAVTLTVGSANPFVMDYRADGRFGWKASPTSAIQYTYYAPPDLYEATDESWGDWRGKPYVDGTYTVALWGNTNIEYARNGEHQVYRGTARPAQQNVLYGAATTVEPYSIIDTTVTAGVADDPCNSCHGDLRFHGSSRRGSYACMVCHATAGAQVNFATIVHGFHAETLPVMPNGAGACATCHGTSTTYSAPTDHTHPAAGSTPAHRWGQACAGCHTAAPAVAHIQTMTVEGGGEACETCHGASGDFPVAVMHQAR